MRKHDLIDGIQTVLTFALIFATFYFAMMIFSGCGSTRMCPAYQEHAKVEKTKRKSTPSDPKPRISRGYVNYVGTR